MKVSCQSCQARYTIADDKVLGKIVKIRCKKCSSTIVVNGNDPAAALGSGQASAQASSEFSPGDGGPEEWTVNVADGDQRTMTQDEIVAAYRSQTIHDETYCWREGMADWAVLREIPSLLAACALGSPSSPASRPNVSGGAFSDLPIDFGAAAGPAVEASAAGAPGFELQRAGIPAAASPVAARRAGGGRAPIADLFGGVAQAGGEDDVMTSAPVKLPQPHESEDPHKLTGARNENSVLFSLSTLTGKADAPARVPESEGSGLIDIRQLSAQIGAADDGKKSSRVDDIMNLSGGGFTPALTAPVLLAPTIEPYSERRVGPSAAPGAAKNKGLIVLAAGLGALVIVAAVGGAMSIMHKGSSTATGPKETSSARAEEAPSAASAASAQATAPAAKSAAAEEKAAPAPEASREPAPAASAQAPVEPEAEHASPSTPEVRLVRSSAKEAPPPPKPAAPAVSDQPFNMGEARARLGAAAESVQPCKRGDSTGTGHVLITFAPGGSVQSVTVDGPPFQGTSAGACVAAHFRSVRVPPFSGGPFRVRKSFTIN